MRGFAPGEQPGQEAGLLAQLGTWQATRQVREPTCPQMSLFTCAAVAPTACAPSLSVGAGLGAAGGSPGVGHRKKVFTSSRASSETLRCVNASFLLHTSSLAGSA